MSQSELEFLMISEWLLGQVPLVRGLIRTGVNQVQEPLWLGVFRLK